MMKNSGINKLDLDTLYAVTQCRHTNDLSAAAHAFCVTHGFSRWIYGLVGPDQVLTNYPETWVASYAKNRWHRGHDPIVNAINERRRSVGWDLRNARSFGPSLSAVQKRILSERWDAGVRSGVTAPVYDRPGAGFEYGVVSFSREAKLMEKEQLLREPRVQLFATYFHSVAPQLLVPPIHRETPTIVALTPREHDCLSWVAQGKTSWEIGLLLTISEATVNFHLANAARKLGVHGRTLAIGRAIRLGLIAPQ